MSIKTFKGQSLFKGLSKDFLAQLDAIAVQESIEKRTILINNGDPAKYFYLLEEGRICIRDERKKHSVSFLHTPGDFFGWSCLLDRPTYSASAECVIPSKIVRIEKKKLDALFKKDCLNGLIFIKNFADIVGGRFLDTHSTHDWFPAIET
jgi:CRP/FNR family transcriptional regulator, cyclic AMP receptor protein